MPITVLTFYQPSGFVILIHPQIFVNVHVSEFTFAVSERTKLGFLCPDSKSLKSCTTIFFSGDPHPIFCL